MDHIVFGSIFADVQNVQELHDKANIDYDHVDIQHNPSVASLYEDALVYESGSAITSEGALATSSGTKTGRSPQGIIYYPPPYQKYPVDILPHRQAHRS